jgi:hypothetical protein
MNLHREMWPAAVVALALTAAPAEASPQDAASAHTALRAYTRYLGAAVEALPAMSQAGDAYVASIQSGCPGVLAPIGALRDGSYNADAADAVFTEAGYDLVAATLVPDHAPLVRLAKDVQSLRWSARRTGAKVRRSLEAQQRWLQFPPSDLCANAATWAAAPSSTPPGTSQFDEQYESLASAAGLGGFTSVLSRFATRRDRRLLQRANRDGKRFVAGATRILDRLGPALADALFGPVTAGQAPAEPWNG